MITRLRGELIAKSPTEVVVDVNGVGYGVHIPVSTFEKIGDLHSTVQLYTHLHVREDLLQLYGFATDEERAVFRLLISVTGIGPKMAQGILSGISVSDLRSYLASGNTAALISIPGVGRKLADRLVVELREKMGRLDTGGTGTAFPADAQGSMRSEAMLALTSLGYNRAVAERALRAALEELSGNSPTVEGLIKAALRHAAG
jgi:Holliday junction DNA helicase RuvA